MRMYLTALLLDVSREDGATGGRVERLSVVERKD